jgi:ATP-binding cassette, subfamily B, multidrug efflux pump
MSLVFKYIKKYKWHYVLGFFLLVLINSLGASIPQEIKKAVNLLQELVKNNSKQNQVSETIFYTVLLVLGMAFIMALFRVWSRYLIFGVGRQIESDLKRDIFNHLIKFEPEFFQRRKTGDLISIITSDVQSLRAFGGFAMLNILNTSISFSIVVPLMYSLNAELTKYFLIIIPLMLSVVALVSKRLKDFQEMVQVKLGELSNFIEQNLSAIHIIKIYAQEASEVERFNETNLDLKNKYLDLIKVRSLIGPLMKVIGSIGFILLLLVGGRASINSEFSLGDFAAYSLYIERLLWPIATLGWLITVAFKAKVSSKRINEIFQEIPKIKDSESSIQKDNFNESLELKKLDCKILKGTSVGIVGRIGSGKSVLANKIMRLIEPADEEILLDGIDIKNLKLNSLRSLINLVPQENFLFSTSIKENISYGRNLSEEKIIELAKAVCIYDEIINFDKGFETVVGEGGITLSGGQRQRISIARALALEPEILILDDALSSVDNLTCTQIFHNINQLRKGKTTILITHKVSLIKDFDKILVMDKTKIT